MSRSVKYMSGTPIGGVIDDEKTDIDGAKSLDSEESVQIARVTETLYAAGQINAGTVPVILKAGIASVICLRELHEDGFIDVGPVLAPHGIEVHHCPIAKTGWGDQIVDRILVVIDTCKMPCLVFDDSGLRSTALCVAYCETREQLQERFSTQTHGWRRTSGADMEMLMTNVSRNHDNWTLQMFVQQYVQRKLKVATTRQAPKRLGGDLYISGQLTKDELMGLPSMGIKSVVNMRAMTEAGEFGLGVLAQESEIREELEKLPRPILVHCLTGERVSALVSDDMFEANRDDLEAQIAIQAAPNKESATLWLKTVIVSVCMGVLFGVAMESGKVTLPVVIRQQFLFQRFIMLKMFLSAAGTSALALALTSIFAPKAFTEARVLFMGCGCGKGIIGICVGTFILGTGMAIAGACPGMVLIQVGSAVENSGFTLLGGMIAALLYGFVQPWVAPMLKAGMYKKEKVDDFALFRGIPFWQLAGSLFGMLALCVIIFEYFFAWDSGSELPTGLTPWKNAWPPELSGVIIGSLQIPGVLFVGDTLGSSSSYMTIVSQWLGFSDALKNKFPHLAGYRTGAGNWWQVIYIGGAILGACFTSNMTGTVGMARGVPVADAIIGGFLMIFGSRMASGCTSGHGLSGMALLSIQSVLAVPAMFAGGIVTAFVYNAVDPSSYIRL